MVPQASPEGQEEEAGTLTTRKQKWEKRRRRLARLRYVKQKLRVAEAGIGMATYLRVEMTLPGVGRSLFGLVSPEDIQKSQEEVARALFPVAALEQEGGDAP